MNNRGNSHARSVLWSHDRGMNRAPAPMVCSASRKRGGGRHSRFIKLSTLQA